MSRFINNKDEVEFIYSSFVVSNTVQGPLSDPNQLTTSTSTFISGNRSGDYVSRQTFHQAIPGEVSPNDFMFHVSVDQSNVAKGYGLVTAPCSSRGDSVV
jgi:hypothetical protein